MSTGTSFAEVKAKGSGGWGKEGYLGREMGKPSASVVRSQHLWSMLYANDTGIVSRSPESVAKMMAAIVKLCEAFGLIVSKKKTETMRMCAPHVPVRVIDIATAAQSYKQPTDFLYPETSINKKAGLLCLEFLDVVPVRSLHRTLSGRKYPYWKNVNNTVPQRALKLSAVTRIEAP